MNNQYMSYDYKELNIYNDLDLRRLDALECFGWVIDENKSVAQKKYILKRLRHIVNKTELTRLERNLDSCFCEIVELQKSVRSYALTIVLTIAMIGTIFGIFNICSYSRAATSYPMYYICHSRFYWLDFALLLK